MVHVVIGTAGHIDHGKTALVRALTGIDTDRLKEERERGITIDLGFAHLSRGDTTLAFVDVPGHERFVKNMLAGATGVDAVLLVVAATESVKPQTREHFEICRLLRLRRGVIALTKVDLVDAETLDLVRSEVADLVADSFLETAPVVAVSSITRFGLDQLSQALFALSDFRSGRPEAGPFRMPIDRVFSVKGFGTVATGTVVSGRARPDDVLEVLPAGRAVKVRSLQGHGSSVPAVVAGQRAAVNLTGIDVSGLRRGDSLACPSCFLPTERLDARLDVLHTATVKHGARVRFHQGTSETLGRIALGPVDSSLRGAETLAIPPGTAAYVRIRLERPVVVTRGDRFVIRSYSPAVTVGGGVVLDPHAARVAIRTPAAFRRFTALDPALHGEGTETAVDRAVGVFVGERGLAGLEWRALISRAGLTVAQAEEVTNRLGAAGVADRIGDALVSRAARDRVEGELMAILGAYHATQPQSDGVPREEMRERLFADAAPGLFEDLLAALTKIQLVDAHGRLALATHRAAAASAMTSTADRVAQVLLDCRLQPPDVAQLAVAVGVPTAALDQALRQLQRQRVAVKLDRLWFHLQVLEELAAAVRALTGRRMEVAEFKTRFGLSRKYAIPLLEYLDRERVTKRAGESRIVL